MHEERIQRARWALEGLSVGDALGERFFGPLQKVLPRIEARQVPEGSWRYTDDTEMALGVFEHLGANGQINQDKLAKEFAARLDYTRGYGRMACQILEGIRRGESWHSLSHGAFGGQGSLGNGSAMRVAPLGAYFADDIERCIAECRLQAELTHAHVEGIDGAVAIGVATSLLWQQRDQATLGASLMRGVVQHLPLGEIRFGIERALALPADTTTAAAAEALGSGSEIRASDTVPFCIWIAARHGHSYEEAFWQTVSALGDRDTTCAIVGGMVATATEGRGIPLAWQASREALPLSTP